MTALLLWYDHDNTSKSRHTQPKEVTTVPTMISMTAGALRSTSPEEAAGCDYDQGLLQMFALMNGGTVTSVAALIECMFALRALRAGKIESAVILNEGVTEPLVKSAAMLLRVNANEGFRDGVLDFMSLYSGVMGRDVMLGHVMVRHASAVC